jgi:2-(1,2-epoxy-1,2-dihydrophenyl)acetyl-CoA isomerase
VVADDALDEFVADWARRLAAAAPIAISQTKRLLNNGMNATLEQALDEEGAAQSINFTTEDTAEAVRAFLDKREPTFRGR